MPPGRAWRRTAAILLCALAALPLAALPLAAGELVDFTILGE
jgi:hypothetical protein